MCITTKMARIFKYPLELADKQTVEMPKGSEILTAHTQHDVMTLWALVPDERYDGFPTEQRTIQIIGTGHYVSRRPNQDQELLKYIATVFQGPFVWHVFEDLPPQ